MRQLSMFTPAEVAGMRDRTASRNYSASRDEFRREHERHRAWGLTRRHAKRLRDARSIPHRSPAASTTAHDRTQDPSPSPTAEPTSRQQTTHPGAERELSDQPGLLASPPAARFGPARFGPARFGPARFGPARFGPARFGPARFGPAGTLGERSRRAPATTRNRPQDTPGGGIASATDTIPTDRHHLCRAESVFRPTQQFPRHYKV
jgi:hypothetical protein